MSLLLDALKKAAQEKLDREKKDRQQGSVEENELPTMDHTQSEHEFFPENDQTVSESTSTADATEIDTTSLAASGDRTEVDTTSLAAQPEDRTEYDAGIAPDDIREQSSRNSPAEEELQLEPELALESDTDETALFRASKTQLQRSRQAADDLYALDRHDTAGVHARGERTTDFDLDLTRQDQTNPQRTYSSSLTENLQAEQQHYYSGSPLQAAQIFAGKSQDRTKRLRLYILSGLAVFAVVVLALLFGIDYVAELRQSQFITPVSRSRLDEPPLSASLNRVRKTTETAGEEEVDPELLIEQEDYTELLQDTLTSYEEKPAADERPSAPARPTPAARPAPVAPAQQTVAGRSGEYTISRSKPRGETLTAILLRGYQAYQRGELDNAEINYRQALTRAPRNRDALLGMAAIHVARGETEMAQNHYNRLLQLDPHDDLALAGVSGLGQQPGKAEAEISRIKLMLADRPDSAHLNFALGNLYANQKRWADAQQAYFDSVRLDEKNPDYIFNLAVSLEHLGQNQSAIRFYRQALALSQNRRSHFDQAQAHTRLQMLSAGNTNRR